MHRAHTLLIAVVVAGLSIAPVRAAQESRTREDAAPPLSAAEQELVTLERAWDAAFVAKNVRFIERIIADDFVVIYGDGRRGDKAAELAETLDFDQQVDSSVLDEFRVRIYGETAVVGFSRHMTGPKGGKIISVTYRFVDVFVKRDGRWQCVSSQSTKVTPAS